MTINKIINTHVPQVAVQSPHHGSAKKKESFFWQRPLLYTALAVAGLATILFVANGWGSSPTPPPKVPNPQPKPNPRPNSGNNAAPVQPAQEPSSPNWKRLTDFLHAIESMNTLEEVENYVKSMDPKKAPDIFHVNPTMDYIAVGRYVAQIHWDNQRQDCPDPTKVCPAPTYHCIPGEGAVTAIPETVEDVVNNHPVRQLLLQSLKESEKNHHPFPGVLLGQAPVTYSSIMKTLNETPPSIAEYEISNCKHINKYVLRILKEDCPIWMSCEGKYCPQKNFSRLVNIPNSFREERSRFFGTKDPRSIRVWGTGFNLESTFHSLLSRAYGG